MHISKSRKWASTNLKNSVHLLEARRTGVYSGYIRDPMLCSVPCPSLYDLPGGFDLELAVKDSKPTGIVPKPIHATSSSHCVENTSLNSDLRRCLKIMGSPKLWAPPSTEIRPSVSSSSSPPVFSPNKALSVPSFTWSTSTPFLFSPSLLPASERGDDSALS